MNNLDEIDRFFTSAPDPGRAREFEERMQTDPVFAEEVAFYLSAHSIAQEGAGAEKKRRFREIYQVNRDKADNPVLPADGHAPVEKSIRLNPFRKMLTYMAAAAVVGIIVAVYLFRNTESPRQIAVKYEREHLQTLGITMSGSSDSIQTGLRLYNEGKTNKALEQFESIIQSDTSNFTAKKYAGLSALRQKQYDKALSYFEQLDSYKGLYANPAPLYLAVTLMERDQDGDLAKAKRLLQKIVSEDMEGKELAQEWLKKM
jgi:tetratricopeptide (TPR) repeat protein